MHFNCQMASLPITTRVPSTPWLFLHIPKCGGTTMCEILARQFGAAFKHGSSLIDWPCFNDVQTREILSSFPDVMCFADHRFAIPSLDQTSTNQIAFTFVRDPFERICSEYFFNRERVYYKPAARKMALEDYLQWAVIEGNCPENVDYQCKWLSGSGGRNIDAVLSPEGIFESLQRQVFPLERFDEVLVLLQELYPSVFQDCAYVKLNATPRNQTVSSELEQCVRVASQRDLELLRLAHRSLDDQLSRVFSVPGELQNALDRLRLSCVKLERNQRCLIFRTAKKIGRMMSRIQDRCLK